MQTQKLEFLFILLIGFLVKASRYDITQANYPIELWWKCQGVPNLQSQRVGYIEEAAKRYYMAKSAGRDMEDRNLDDHVPPTSILTDKVYMSLFDQVMVEPDEGLNSQLMMRLNCELFNDLDWVRDVYDGELSRNTNGVRGMLDIIYRMALCIRGIDKYLNCPDICRSSGPKFCEDAQFSTKVCGTITAQELTHYVVDKEKDNATDLSENFKEWHSAIPPEKRLPLKFLRRFSTNKKILENAHRAQILTAQSPFCICDAFYIYDVVQQSCVEDVADFACGGGNPCLNDGLCQKYTPLTNTTKNHDDDEEEEEAETGNTALFVCICLPAFKGKECEEERDPCASGNGVKVCEPFGCLRDESDKLNGFRCRCPYKTHKSRGPTDPTCIPFPACGEDENSHGPCEAGGKCNQDKDNPQSYTCQCVPGFSGKHCEDPPPEPSWSTWSEWSVCKWPRPAEACFNRAFQECKRDCTVYAPDQACQGPSRKIRYRGCDLSIDSEEVRNSISTEEKANLEMAIEMCSLSASVSRPSSSVKLKKAELVEPLDDPMTLDDWSNVGPEEASLTLLPERFQLLDTVALEAINWPSMADLMYMTTWFYSSLLLLSLVLWWIVQLRGWILKRKGVDQYNEY